MLLKQDRALTAISVMLDVAFHVGRGAEVASGGDIADRLGAAKRGIEPVFQALSRAGLLDSTRGPRGGYRLARRSRDIRLWDVVSAVAEEEESPDMTGQLQAAVVAPLWGEMEGLLRERLEGMTLDDLLRRAQARGLKRPSTEPLNFAI
ncbi:Rrf2 family protein [Roseomonas mucosa]|jgi:Rrf2 family transcriptional regulator, iron-sulfur cluster assembly transcription factor|uniref:Transcriptional regulator n=1 Tax=Roseomonas mucosa TaxID=207340 RepID=A0A1S8D7E3_9PROT|nr:MULTISPECIES: Rrf2 family transcriptional regulator [Roseomonas]MBS5902118.1 Rrf2 family transcriptional regulator [Acetobacteraceae bacterium]ATR21218.1 Rrf2 family transcriptional regulator [Roseomonas sp. FDAARGOS_362]MCG7351053.1 Rrf2 family transcriptional regulator [Roseomonas mucosa]MCG7356821.1 Rrf2 family transcriptional regulator [Roseomonas mucosa]MDT8288589.1 Rrf2 family transcriptional regulator [Roseomonas mucosa]